MNETTTQSRDNIGKEALQLNPEQDDKMLLQESTLIPIMNTDLNTDEKPKTEEDLKEVKQID